MKKIDKALLVSFGLDADVDVIDLANTTNDESWSEVANLKQTLQRTEIERDVFKQLYQDMVEKVVKNNA